MQRNNHSRIIEKTPPRTSPFSRADNDHNLLHYHQKLKTDVETFHRTSLQGFQSTDID